MNRMGLFILVVTMITLVSALVFIPEPTVALLFGWMAYLYRVLPDVETRWDGVLIFLTGLLLFTLVFHRLSNWLRREMTDETKRWSWRSTFLVVAGVMLMFIAGTAMVGITHQAAWLASEPEPLWGPALPKDSYRQNLRMLGGEVEGFYSFRGRFPNPEQSWATQVLRYQIDMDESKPWNHPDNQAEARKLVPLLLNSDLVPIVLHDQDGYGVSHYAGNRNLFERDEKFSLKDVSDGTANTLMIGEVSANFQPWAKPRTNRDPALGINRSPDGFGGAPGTGGAYFLMADGSVRFLSHKTAPRIVEALGTPDGNESIDESVLQK